MKKIVSSGFLIVLVLLVPLAAGTVYGGSGGGELSEKKAVFIGFTERPGPAEEALVRQAGGDIKHKYQLVRAFAVSLPPAAIDGLERNPRVSYIEPDTEVHVIDHPTGDSELDKGWGVAHIRSGTVHAGGNKGKGVKVGVLDTGIDTDHPDLKYDASCSYGTSYGTVEDRHGHGTHTAGTVAALDNGAGVVGVAPEVTLCIFKVLSDSGGGSYSDVVAALDFIFNYNTTAQVPIRVTNNSYGSAGYPGDTVKAAFDNTYAAGVLHVAAAGNAGNPQSDNCIYPALWDTLIATAATMEDDNRASFSSTCPQMELAAPGYQINSTVPGGYGTKSGTSMASPHVAGTAALVLAANSGWGNDQVRAQLKATADDLGDPGRDSLYGFGLVQANGAALPDPSNNPPSVSISSPADSSTFDSEATILFEGIASDIEDGDPTANLAWTSDIDGQIGSGGSFSTTLSDGNHTITASVTDSGGKTGSASKSITVGTPPPEATTVSVAFITYATEGGRNKNKHLLITVSLVDDLGNAVSGASASYRLDNTTTGKSWVGKTTSGIDTPATFSLKNAKSGCYTTKIINVTASGLTWDGITPANEFCR